MLLGEKARKGNQGGKCQRQLPQLRLQMKRGKNARQCGGVVTGKRTKNAICRPSSM